MTNSELIKVVEEATGATQKDVKAIIGVISTTIQNALLRGEQVKFADLGTFKLGVVAAKAERPNPLKDGIIPAKDEHNKPKMQFAKSVKVAIEEATLGRAFK